MDGDPGAAPRSADVRVLLVDDHPAVRRGLRALLSSLPGIEVAGEAASGSEAVREAQLLGADVVVMDLQMPGLDGVSATARIVAAAPRSAVLVLTMFDDDESVLAALRAGARGYLLKGPDQEDIAHAVHAVHAGQVVLAPDVAARLVHRLSGAPAPATAPFPELTDREREVLAGRRPGTTLEEERRRLRRDLHDGLGPVLTGIAYSAARNLLRTDPGQAEELLGALREDTASSIAEVRRLVHGLRPPALDERGLAGAVLQRVERLRCADGSALVTEVVTEGPLSGLPAAVEVAAYRVAVEAVTTSRGTRGGHVPARRAPRGWSSSWTPTTSCSPSPTAARGRARGPRVSGSPRCGSAASSCTGA